MCIAVPGLIKSISGEAPLSLLGQVDFGGVEREINLSFVPEAKIGQYVLVHAGFAITVIDEAEARRVFDDLEAMFEAGDKENGKN